MTLYHKIIFTALIFLSVSNNQSFAGGYSTNLYSTSGLGNAYAGSVTGIHDVSDMFFNPSVTAGLKNNQFIASANYLKLDIKTDSASNSGNAGVNNLVPAFYLASPVNDDTTLNLSITSPFGLASKYDSGWAGRYIAIESSISTININPSLSYKLSDDLSIGAGFVAQYYQGSLTKAVFTGGNDALGKLSGSGWGYGYNLGANYKFNDQLKFGIGYRSKIDYKLTGQTKVENLGLYSDFNAKTTTPESLTIGASYKLNQKVELAYDTTWIRWSRLKTLVVNAYQNSALNDTAVFNWHDSYLYSIGANFKTSQKTLLRTGLAYEKDAITDANREPRVPGSNRFWTTIGFNHQLCDGWAVDGAYIHQFFKDAKMNITESNSTVNSRYKVAVDVFSIALKKDF